METKVSLELAEDANSAPIEKKRFGLDATQRETFSRLAHLCKPERGRIICGILALCTNSATNLCFPWILGQAVDRAADPDYMLFVSGTAGIYLVGSLASWVRVYCLGTSTEKISARLKKMLFNSYMDKSIDFYDGERAAELALVLDKDVALAAETLTEKIAFGVRSLNSSINGSILMIYSAPELCRFSLSIVPVVGIGAMLLSKYAKRIRTKLRELESVAASFALERLQRITTVRLNAQEDKEKKNYEQYVNECYDLSSSAYFVQGSYMSFTNLMTNASLMGVLWYGGRLLAKGKMTAGSLTRFAIQTAFVGLGWFGLAKSYGEIVTSLEAAGRVFKMVDSTGARDLLDAQQEQGTNNSLNNDSNSVEKDGKLMFVDSMTFSYSSRSDTQVLKGITVSIPKRSLIGFAGKSGTGKSTLSAIFSGLYKSTGGSFIVDGKNVNSMSSMDQRRFLQDNIAVVQQNTGLLSGTISENIAYGRSASDSDENVTQEQIEEAAKYAQAEQFISEFPNGYDTQVGEGGNKLSGGQQARIAIARALLKKPKCLLLDEATAALDTESEGEIITLLKKLVKEQDFTVVVFTHSEALMKACDEVHVLKEGIIKGSGNHSSLAKSGLLLNLHDE